MSAAWQFTAWGIPVLLAIGTGLMSTPAYWARVVSCAVFVLTGLWGGFAIAMWARAIRGWTARHRLVLAGAVTADIVLTVGLGWFALPMTEADAQTQAAPAAPHDNTFYNAVPSPGLAQGSDNTVVGPTDSNGNTIIRGGTVVGSHACGGPGDVVIGSHANGGACPH